MGNRFTDFFKLDFSEGFGLKNVVLLGLVLFMIWIAADVLSTSAAGINPVEIIDELDREVTNNINVLIFAAREETEEPEDYFEVQPRYYAARDGEESAESSP
ncbi:MAG TPA: hypothetical protein ENN55_01340, partial [Firmicutes bacterium]|nr:hypothetical protein [Bacillota bacterium]